MHEMSYAVRIADIALRAANANPPGSASADNRPAGGLNPKDGSSENRILAVHVSCGEMLAIVPSLLETAFPRVREGYDCGKCSAHRKNNPRQDPLCILRQGN